MFPAHIVYLILNPWSMKIFSMKRLMLPAHKNNGIQCTGWERSKHMNVVQWSMYTCTSTDHTLCYGINCIAFAHCFHLITMCYGHLLANVHAQWGLQYLICVPVRLCQLLDISLLEWLLVPQTHQFRRSKILSNFLWKCFVAKLECFLIVQQQWVSHFFTPRMHVKLDHVASSHFVFIMAWNKSDEANMLISTASKGLHFSAFVKVSKTGLWQYLYCTLCHVSTVKTLCPMKLDIYDTQVTLLKGKHLGKLTCCKPQPPLNGEYSGSWHKLLTQANQTLFSILMRGCGWAKLVNRWPGDKNTTHLSLVWTEGVHFTGKVKDINAWPQYTTVNTLQI